MPCRPHHQGTVWEDQRFNIFTVGLRCKEVISEVSTTTTELLRSFGLTGFFQVLLVEATAVLALNTVDAACLRS